MTYLFKDLVEDADWIKVEASTLQSAFVKYMEFYTKNEDDEFIQECCKALDIELIDVKKVECYE